MSHYKRVFIIGHPGAGKGFIAKVLAERLGWQVIDADLGLEFNIGRGLREILGNEGQESFYDCQSEILSSLRTKEHIVVVTDGSVVCSEKNRQLLSSELVVYLHVSTPVQMERIARQPETLLPIASQQEFFEQLHSERDKLYEQVAKLIIHSDDSALEEYVLAVIEHITNDEKDIKTGKRYLDKRDLAFMHKTLHTLVYLPEQQAKCVKLLAQGKSSKIIAREIGISHRTVEGTIAKAMELLGCSSSKELIALYYLHE